MDQKMRDFAAELRRMPPSKGSEWLMDRFPIEGEHWVQALDLLGHTSFPRREARQLATYYLARAPYASDKPYRVFAKLLGVTGLLAVLSGMLPQLRLKSDLLLYHLKPVLDGVGNEAERQAAFAFVTSLAARG